jgi:hypothetical protein
LVRPARDDIEGLLAWRNMVPSKAGAERSCISFCRRRLPVAGLRPVPRRLTFHKERFRCFRSGFRCCQSPTSGGRRPSVPNGLKIPTDFGPVARMNRSSKDRKFERRWPDLENPFPCEPSSTRFPPVVAAPEPSKVRNIWRGVARLTRAYSSIGQSPRLITGPFLVRIRVGPLGGGRWAGGEAASRGPARIADDADRSILRRRAWRNVRLTCHFRAVALGRYQRRFTV